MPDAPDVHICEVGPRDGLQNLDMFVPTAAKCALIDAIAAAGVREIDAGSFVPPKIVPQFADVDAVMAHALAHKAITIGALVPNFKGAERAIAAGVDAIYFVISASETHNQANVRRTIDEQLEGFRAVRAAIDARPAGSRPHLSGAYLDRVRLLDGRPHRRGARCAASRRLCRGGRRRDRTRRHRRLRHAAFDQDRSSRRVRSDLGPTMTLAAASA